MKLTNGGKKKKVKKMQVSVTYVSEEFSVVVR